jgi:hypothetical protein
MPVPALICSLTISATVDMGGLIFCETISLVRSLYYFFEDVTAVFDWLLVRIDVFTRKAVFFHDLPMSFPARCAGQHRRHCYNDPHCRRRRTRP